MGNRKYYTLLVRESDGKWAIAFGDYSRAVVKQEEKDEYSRPLYGNYFPSKDRMIITTGETQAEITAKVDQLNGSR
jgi:hypothetical protein